MSSAGIAFRLEYVDAQLADLDKTIPAKEALLASGKPKGYNRRMLAEQVRIAKETRLDLTIEREALAAQLAAL